MQSDPAIVFRPVVADDLPRIEGWLHAPHIARWWGNPETEIGYIRDMTEGRDSTRPFVFEIDGQPVGYIQYWFVGHWQHGDWSKQYPWLDELPANAVGVDLSIGESGLVSKGIGSRVLSMFVKRLRNEGHETIIIDPDPANTRAVRAYEKADFVPLPDMIGRCDDTLIMQHQPRQTGGPHV